MVVVGKTTPSKPFGVELLKSVPEAVTVVMYLDLDLEPSLLASRSLEGKMILLLCMGDNTSLS